MSISSAGLAMVGAGGETTGVLSLWPLAVPAVLSVLLPVLEDEFCADAWPVDELPCVAGTGESLA
jgi:hypothetical protein